jgi:aminopeptidase N
MPQDIPVQPVPEAAAVPPADTLPEEVPPDRGPYRAERTMEFALVHTTIEATFDWAERRMRGVATLHLRPHFYPQERLQLDARHMDIHSVVLLPGDSPQGVTFDYVDDSLLFIDLPRTFTRDESLALRIEYTTNTYRRDGSAGRAILSDRGLYFINHDGSQPGKPQQIWTQGETSSGSMWFPTIDAPNQRCTQDMYLTVDERFKTLSNGILVYSRSNPGGTRTDYWRMDKPHAPYLFMIAVGEYAVVEDRWRDLPVQYFVEPEYEPYARHIFGRTPQMIDFFSGLLDYPFPWDKYAQVVVRDFVSGAMENTTASVYMEDLQVNRRTLIDSDWDDIIAHELFHQWFGDLVTCESWANLVLNEGFATYSEYLWKDHHRGRDEAEYKRYEEWLDYLDEAQTKKEDLVRFHYPSEEGLFDSHSYAKGSLILHMLRREIGDEAFFAALRHYLKEHAYSDVEIHDLRLAFERVTGRDLNWFFNQWFLAAGHPELQVEDRYDDSTGVYRLTVRQLQDTDRFPLYRLPVRAEVWVEGRKLDWSLLLEGAECTFERTLPGAPELVMVDPDADLVAEWQFERPAEQYALQYRRYPASLRVRLQSLEYFEENGTHDLAEGLMLRGLTDPAAPLRQIAIAYFDRLEGELPAEVDAIVSRLAWEDPSSLVRADALSAVADRRAEPEQLRRALQDSSYAVCGVALYHFLQLADLEAEKEALIGQYSNETDFNITAVLADRFIETRDYSRFDWFAAQAGSARGQYQWYMVRLFGYYLVVAPDSLAQQGIELLAGIARQHPHYFIRSAAVNSLQILSDRPGVTERLDLIRREEDDERVRSQLD